MDAMSGLQVGSGVDINKVLDRVISSAGYCCDIKRIDLKARLDGYGYSEFDDMKKKMSFSNQAHMKFDDIRMLITQLGKVIVQYGYKESSDLVKLREELERVVR